MSENKGQRAKDIELSGHLQRFLEPYTFFIPWNEFPDFKIGRSYGALMILE